MSSITALAVRIARLATLTQQPIKESKAEALAQRVCEHVFGVGVTPTPEALANLGADVILDRLKFYRSAGADIFANNGTAMDRLEKCNRDALAKPRPAGVGATPRKRPMTEAERATFAALPPHLKQAFADNTLLSAEFKEEEDD